MSLPLPLSGSSRPILVSTGITLLHLGLFGILAAQATTPAVLPEITPVQLIALAPEPEPAAPAPEPAPAPAPEKPKKSAKAPVRKSPPKPTVKPERKPDPIPRAKTPSPKEPAPQRNSAAAQPTQADKPESSTDTAPRNTESPGKTPAGQGQANNDAPAAPAVELPSTRASYLNNPKPPYPASSKRLGETGTVLLRVLVGADGSAERVALKKSSGFDALDNSALETVRRWRFVPGKRNGVPTAMEYTVPIAFRLE
ncbi:energy transducer TonB [Brachymonas denitrificans]|uniref:energy transducer TonB n=1 Tax=Brachymonas denitrificans TaxID=28220 RepID=UPI002AFF95ED|nr:energy transducer TonB [Brachymonas denitrificans]